MGGKCGFESLPLWWARYDGQETWYNDWQAFGCWSKPTVKQYQGTTSLCGAGVDLNWYP